MAFIDELKIHLKAGSGGNGVIRWLHEKGIDHAGPAGGNGGKGGDVYLKTLRDVGILYKYQNIKEFSAKRGVDGMKKSMHGKDGEDFYFELPIGSVVTNLVTREKFELEKEGEEIKVLNGGRGGLGNEYFKSSRNISPEQCSEGKRGEEADFFIELQLMADAGFVGLPNAGKSSLINALTNTKSKVASYQFTTLEPHLGDMHGFILADIPGLIEGASEGKGLGHKFLRHIKRTKIILHCVSLDSKKPLADYVVIRKELENYSEVLAEKKEIVILTKTDEVDEKRVKEVKKIIAKKNKNILEVSILDDKSIKVLKDTLIKKLREESK
ncbi:MAG: GTPase ObgE [Minisyncoccia bacterium]